MSQVDKERAEFVARQFQTGKVDITNTTSRIRNEMLQVIRLQYVEHPEKSLEELIEMAQTNSPGLYGTIIGKLTQESMADSLLKTVKRSKSKIASVITAKGKVSLTTEEADTLKEFGAFVESEASEFAKFFKNPEELAQYLTSSAKSKFLGDVIGKADDNELQVFVDAHMSSISNGIAIPEGVTVFDLFPTERPKSDLAEIVAPSIIQDRFDKGYKDIGYLSEDSRFAKIRSQLLNATLPPKEAEIAKEFKSEYQFIQLVAQYKKSVKVDISAFKKCGFEGEKKDFKTWLESEEKNVSKKIEKKLFGHWCKELYAGNISLSELTLNEEQASAYESLLDINSQINESVDQPPEFLSQLQNQQEKSLETLKRTLPVSINTIKGWRNLESQKVAKVESYRAGHRKLESFVEDGFDKDKAAFITKVAKDKEPVSEEDQRLVGQYKTEFSEWIAEFEKGALAEKQKLSRQYKEYVEEHFTAEKINSVMESGLEVLQAAREQEKELEEVKAKKAAGAKKSWRKLANVAQAFGVSSPKQTQLNGPPLARHGAVLDPHTRGDAIKAPMLDIEQLPFNVKVAYRELNKGKELVTKENEKLFPFLKGHKACISQFIALGGTYKDLARIIKKNSSSKVTTKEFDLIGIKIVQQVQDLSPIFDQAFAMADKTLKFAKMKKLSIKEKAQLQESLKGSANELIKDDPVKLSPLVVQELAGMVVQYRKDNKDLAQVKLEESAIKKLGEITRSIAEETAKMHEGFWKDLAKSSGVNHLNTKEKQAIDKVFGPKIQACLKKLPANDPMLQASLYSKLGELLPCERSDGETQEMRVKIVIEDLGKKPEIIEKALDAHVEKTLESQKELLAEAEALEFTRENAEHLMAIVARQLKAIVASERNVELLDGELAADFIADFENEIKKWSKESFPEGGKERMFENLAKIVIQKKAAFGSPEEVIEAQETLKLLAAEIDQRGVERPWNVDSAYGSRSASPVSNPFSPGVLEQADGIRKLVEQQREASISQPQKVGTKKLTLRGRSNTDSDI